MSSIKFRSRFRRSTVVTEKKEAHNANVMDKRRIATIDDTGLGVSAKSKGKKKEGRNREEDDMSWLLGTGTTHDRVTSPGGNRRVTRAHGSIIVKGDSGGALMDGRVPHSENTASFLGVTTRVKEQMQRNINTRQKKPTTVSYIPLMIESEDLRQLRGHNLRGFNAARETPLQGMDMVVKWSPKGSRDPPGSPLAMVRAKGASGTDLISIDGTNNKRKVLSVDDTKFKTDEEIVTKMMMEMDSRQLQLVKKDFQRHGGELELEEFVEVMMKYQPEKDSYESEVNTVAKLCEFFSQVDINGDGSMEWAEFTSYIVESSQDRDNFRVDNIKNYRPSHLPPCGESSYDTRIDHLYYVEELDHFVACDTNRMMNIYNASDCSLIKRVHGHKGVVHNASYLTGRGPSSYLVTCANDSTIGFWDTVNYQLCQQIPTPDVQMTLEWAGVQNNKLFSGGVDGSINVWDVDKLQRVEQLPGHRDIVMDLHSIETMGVIASASLDSEIKFWDVPTQSFRKSLPGHAKGVFSLSYAPEYRFLLSAGFDHDALVWNPYVEQLICPLKGHNSSLVGVKAIPGTPEIITADNEGVFKIWDVRNFSCVQTFSARDAMPKEGEESYGAKVFANPSVRTKQQKGPNASRIGSIGKGGSDTKPQDEVEAVAQRNIEKRRSLASTVLFDSRATEVKTSLSCFTYASKHKRIVAANHDLRFFEYDQPADPLLTDEVPTVGVIFNESALTITTASGKSVKLWDAESGRLLRIYRNISESEITALCFDGRKRKFITGDHNGNVIVYNLANGAKMKELSPHDGEIVALHSLAETQCIISCSWDGVIKISDESDPEEAELLHVLNHNSGVLSILNQYPDGQKEREAVEKQFIERRAKQMKNVTNINSISVQRDVSAMAYSKLHNLLASASADMTICIFRANTGQVESVCLGHEVEISSLVFLDPYPYLVSADMDGNIIIWQIAPLNLKTEPWFKFQNEAKPDKLTTKSCENDDDDDEDRNGVLCLQWMRSSVSLFTGDESGFVRVWNLRNLFDKQLEAITKAKQEQQEQHADDVEDDEGTEQQEGDSSGSFFLTSTEKTSRLARRSLKKKSKKQRTNLASELAKLRKLKEEQGTTKIVPKVEHSWQAHKKAGVRSLFLIENPNAVATSSFDCVVQFWSLTGTSLGQLYQGSSQDRYVDRNWKFPVNRDEQHRLTINRAEQVLGQICQENGRVKRVQDMDMLSLTSSVSTIQNNNNQLGDDDDDDDDDNSNNNNKLKDDDVRTESRVSKSSTNRTKTPTPPQSRKPVSTKPRRPNLRRQITLTSDQQQAADRLFNALL